VIRVYIILFLTILSFTTRAQESASVSSSARAKLEKVNEAISGYQWDEARKQAEKLVRQNPEWAEAWKVYAESCQGAGDVSAAVGALENLVKLDSVRYPEAWRWIAQMRFEQGNYERAADCMKRYIKQVKDTAGLPFRVRLLRSSITFARATANGTTKLHPVKLDSAVNTSDDEYFPSLSVDGSVLAFTRQRRTGTRRAEIQEDLYFALQTDSGYTSPKPYPDPMNSSGNDGTQSMSQDGRIMFFTSCNRPDTKGGCDLYYCIKTGDQWSVPLNMGYPVNSRYWESTPFLAHDGRRLLFSSNRPGGTGGMDIWETRLQADRSWSAPRNIGAPVNTPLDEMSPNLLPDGRTLFFTSNGHPGLGGFDLFRYVPTPENKIGVQNLGTAINSRFNEDGIAVNASLGSGLFSSDRDSSGGKDIYQCDFTTWLPAQRIFTISGLVSDAANGKPVEARIEIKPHGDSLVSRVNSDPVSGIYLLGIPRRESYRFGAVAPGYLPYSIILSADTLATGSGIIHTVNLQVIDEGVSIILRNTFFTLDSYELLRESEGDLAEVLALLEQNPGMEIEIAGYTDDTGSDTYNQGLSLKRAESVRNYLLSRGIAGNRVIAKGFGRLNPIASNENEAGRKQNRRTEMKIVRRG
jgi:outer membrane protein OmpA-like peptidoglycan-associated protein/Tol biopolymer transport system component